MLVLLVVAANGQYLEKTIWLPDSLGGLELPEVMVLNTVDNKLYVAGGSGDRIVVIDAATHQRVGIIQLSCEGWLWTCYNPAANKVYIADEDEMKVTVIDCAVDEVVAALRLDDPPVAIACDPLANRVYCHTETDKGGDLVIIDCAADSILATVEVGEPFLTISDRRWLEPDPLHGKVYCVVYDTWRIVVKAVESSPARVISEIPLSSFEFFGMVLDSVHDRLVCATETEHSNELVVIETATDSIIGEIELRGEWDEINDIAYNPVYDRTYCLDEEGRLLVVDMTQGQLLEYVYLEDGWGQWLELDIDDDRVYCIGDQNVYVIDAEDNHVLAEVEMVEPVDLDYNPVNGLVYCVEQDDERVSAIDAEGHIVHQVYTGYDVREGVVDGERGRLYCVDQSQDGVLVLDAESGSILTTIFLTRTPYLLEMNAEHTKLYCASTSRRVWVIDLESNQVLAEVPVGTDIEDICYNPVFDKLYVANQVSDNVSVIDGASHALLADIDVGERPRALCCDTVSGMVFCAVRTDDEVWAIDGSGDTVVARLEVGEDPRSLAYNASLREVYCGSYGDSDITVIDAEDLVVLGTVPEVGENIDMLVCDPVQSKLFCAHDDGVTTIDCRSDTILTRIRIDDPVDIALDRSSNTLFCVEDRSNLVLYVDATKDRIRFAADGLHHPRRLVCAEDWNKLFVVSSSSAIQVLRKPALDPIAVGEAGTSFIGRTLNLLGTMPADMIDITGRRMARLRPGMNDLQGLAPGVYFVRREDERAAVRFVVPR